MPKNRDLKIVIFAGPTISSSRIREVLGDVDILPPAARGDVYAAVQRRYANVIGLIDGYFDHRPAVWHKELLWALSNGVEVFGAASIGAIRAAELHIFGMIGVGEIFESFRTGSLEDDDEVAVVHGPRELDYVACSAAMVDIRATLKLAEQEGVLSGSQATEMLATAKATFYPARSYTELGRMHFEGEEEAEEFRDWLCINEVRQKERDALLMLDAIRETVDSRRGATNSVAPDFEETLHWHRLIKSME